MLSGFQNFIGTHFRMYNKKVMSQVIANLSALARKHELFQETLSKILLMLDIAMTLLRPPFVQMAIQNVEVPNYNGIIAVVLLLRNQLTLFNWGNVVSDLAEPMIREITNTQGLGNNVIEYFRMLRVVYANHGGRGLVFHTSNQVSNSKKRKSSLWSSSESCINRHRLIIQVFHV
jgi:hypothetical protein